MLGHDGPSEVIDYYHSYCGEGIQQHRAVTLKKKQCRAFSMLKLYLIKGKGDFEVFVESTALA